MATNRARVLELIRTSFEPLDDDQISRRTGIQPRQTVNIICRGLAKEGLVRRRVGRDGKLVNEPLGERVDGVWRAPRVGTIAMPGADSAALDDAQASKAPRKATSPGNSNEQRAAERVMLDLLGERLGVTLEPTRISIPTGARVEVDGADSKRSILVECWAHQGPAKVGQRNKVLSDALKLVWIAGTLYPQPRLILCLSDSAAAAPFMAGARSWASQALQDLRVDVEVVDLPADLRQRIVTAQRRQSR